MKNDNTNQPASKTESGKPFLPYLVISSKGYWGKGETALEAAKIAHVGGSWVAAQVWKANELVAGEIDCSGMGTAEWYWNDNVPEELQGLLHEAIFIGSGKVKITKGELILQTVV